MWESRISRKHSISHCPPLWHFYTIFCMIFIPHMYFFDRQIYMRVPALPSVCSTVHAAIHLSDGLSVCHLVHPSVIQSVYLSVRLSTYDFLDAPPHLAAFSQTRSAHLMPRIRSCFKKIQKCITHHRISTEWSVSPSVLQLVPPSIHLSLLCS